MNYKTTIVTINYFLKQVVKNHSLTNRGLANILGVSPGLITSYLNDSTMVPTKRAIKLNEWLKSNKNEDLYLDYIFKYTVEEGYLFHGSKTRISGEIDSNRSEDEHDFGRGFYLGETFLQASTWASFDECKGYLYKMKFNKEGLKHINIEGLDWVFFVAYNRGLIPENNETKKLLHKMATFKSSGSKYFFGKIADDRMNESMAMFFNDTMSNIQVEECLKQLKIGNQYCLRNKDATKKVEIIEEYKLDDNLKELIAKYGTNARNEAVSLARKISNHKNAMGKKFSQLLNEYGNK